MIKIYATDTCVYCHALMEWFEKERIKYEAHDANEDPTITSVPVTRIELKDGSIIEVLGFDRPAIKDALKKLAV